MQDINDVISRFLNLIRDSWPSIEAIANTESIDSFKSDWLQASWELAVEGCLSKTLKENIFIEPYGDGADANGNSSRILDQDALATHSVNCVPKNKQSVFDALNNINFQFLPDGLPLDRFVSMGQDGWYYERPPFDMALIDQDGREMVFKISDLDMILVKR